jgi:hypothetical protein
MPRFEVDSNGLATSETSLYLRKKARKGHSIQKDHAPAHDASGVETKAGHETKSDAAHKQPLP